MTLSFSSKTALRSWMDRYREVFTGLQEPNPEAIEEFEALLHTISCGTDASTIPLVEPIEIIRTRAHDDNYGPDVIGDCYFNTPRTIIIIVEPSDTQIKFVGTCPHGHEDWNDCPVCGH